MTYQTPEGKIKAEIKRLLDEYAAYYFMPQPGYLCRNGIAVYIVCLNGTYIAIEAKAGRKVPTAIQQRELDKVEGVGVRLSSSIYIVCELPSGYNPPLDELLLFIGTAYP